MYAEDIQPQMIEAIKRRVAREGLSQRQTILGTPIDPAPARTPVDAVLIVDAYHEMDQPVALLRNVAQRSSPTAASASSTSRKTAAGPGRRWRSASIPSA